MRKKLKKLTLNRVLPLTPSKAYSPESAVLVVSLERLATREYVGT